jgi:crossover junction endodeoxyribonuclease RuvC
VVCPSTPSCLHILGIDPGLNATGWGLISFCDNTLSPLAQGVITTSVRLPFSLRLCQIHEELSSVFEKYHPHEVAIEKTFVNANPLSALKLGMARGLALLVSAQHKIPVFEYAATRVKKTVVGVGHATKDQVALMVQRLLPRVGSVQKDAADALAIAICHAHHQNIRSYTIKEASW